MSDYEWHEACRRCGGTGSEPTGDSCALFAVLILLLVWGAACFAFGWWLG